jgi:hypothetical protein
LGSLAHETGALVGGTTVAACEAHVVDLDEAVVTRVAADDGTGPLPQCSADIALAALF